MALCNMAVEGGAKAGMIAADATTLEWLGGRVPADELRLLAADEGATYAQDITIDIDGMPPLVAAPSSPGNVHPIDELDRGIRVHQVYVGNCANGSLNDLRQLAGMMRGHKVAAGTRLIVVPATQRVYREALVEGIIGTLAEAGAMISAPTCGACFGGSNGILAPDEVAVATTNRNFVGRMGDRTSQVYLGNAFVAGAAALTGELTDPREIFPAVTA
jgi:3-isopropylmalate/(R)-2-methylmalate dehydratase large subunit